jgi:peptidyl-dipeptidase A
VELKLREVYSNKDEFEYLKEIIDSGGLSEPTYQRMADLLYMKYRKNQIEPSLLNQIVGLSTTVEHKFNVYRPIMDGREITNNELYRILKIENNNRKRKGAWEASKMVGEVVESELLELIKLRNSAAESLGYDNYFSMSLALSEQEQGHLLSLYDQLDQLTRSPFLEIKEGLDHLLSKQYCIPARDLRPWHYHDPYFQEAPFIGEVDLDSYYRERDVVEISRLFYQSIGMPVDEIIARSDLYEKGGKNPHAFCTDLDREGDIRVLANVKSNAHWMETMLHELGHAVYDKYIDRSLPYLLRQYPHLCLTEAVAIFFGRCSQLSDWMMKAVGLSEEEAEELSPAMGKYSKTKELIFARWCQTMFHFERELYRDPDQDLNSLWWDLVEKYQFINRPPDRFRPDWAAKTHLVSNPVYYQNYMLGELIASQFYHYLAEEVCREKNPSIYGNRKVGDYFRDIVFKPGNQMPWDCYVESITGEPLTPRHFIQQFAEEKS